MLQLTEGEVVVFYARGYQESSIIEQLAEFGEWMKENELEHNQVFYLIDLLENSSQPRKLSKVFLYPDRIKYLVICGYHIVDLDIEKYKVIEELLFEAGITIIRLNKLTEDLAQ